MCWAKQYYKNTKLLLLSWIVYATFPHGFQQFNCIQSWDMHIFAHSQKKGQDDLGNASWTVLNHKSNLQSFAIFDHWGQTESWIRKTQTKILWHWIFNAANGGPAVGFEAGHGMLLFARVQCINVPFEQKTFRQLLALRKERIQQNMKWLSGVNMTPPI